MSADDTTPSEIDASCPRCGAGYTGEWCPACGLSSLTLPCPEGGETRFRCVLCGEAACEEPSGDRPARCAAHASIPVIERWAQVYTATTDIDGELIAQNLRAEGIDAQVYSQKDDIFPVDLGELSIVRVMVPFWEFQQALGVVVDRMDSSGEVLFACPACGEAYEPGTGACTACGSVLVAG